MLKHIVRMHHIVTASLFTLLLVATPAQAEDELKQQLEQCQQERSALIRLDCYDNILKAAQHTEPSGQVVRSEDIAKILLQEQARTEHSTDFIITQAEGVISPQVILTTPALGTKPPRPVLAFSCLDNITRMQIILHEALPVSGRTLTLKTNTGLKLESHWFVRDQGHVLENSRGLPGISQIQKLFHAETLQIESDNPLLNGLSFKINKLEKEIAPLRQACRW